MIWQDIVISVANLFLTVSLFYQVIYGFKKRKGLLTCTTSGVTTTALYIIAAAYLTIKLYLSAIITALNATLWLMLLIQRLIYKKE